MATPVNPPGIIGLKRSYSKNPNSELYSFGWGPCGGFLINGFVYNKTSGAIHPPSLMFQGKKAPLVKGFGMAWKRLREKLEIEIERFASSEDTGGSGGVGSRNPRTEVDSGPNPDDLRR